MSDTYYRYGEEAIDECGSIRLCCFEFPVLRRTEKGVWLYRRWGKPRFVLNEKRFACPTKEDAISSFIARKKLQLRILRGQIDRAQTAIDLAEGRDLSFVPPIGKFDG